VFRRFELREERACRHALARVNERRGDFHHRHEEFSARVQTRMRQCHCGGRSAVYSIVFSLDGKALASGNADKAVNLWDVTTGRAVFTLSGQIHGVDCVAFSPDGKTLASGSDDKEIKLWDVASGRELRTLSGHTLAVSGVVFFPRREDGCVRFA
jgi:WD40 repeat protein